ncbi:MAG: endonuclease/exonuclease/phosphatase family protein [Rhodospirillales bacterium]
MPTIRVASYNIHRAIGTDGRRDAGRIGAVIGEIDAHIIALQEVDWHDHRHWQVEYLAQLPGYEAVPGPNIRDHRGEYGNLLLTRAPVRQVRRLDLSMSRREPRGAIDADVDIDGTPLRVVATHFGLGAGERWRQAVRLGRALSAGPDGATVLLGDLNDWTPGSLSLRPLLRLCGPAPHAPTFPSRRPLFALDRILVRQLPPPIGFRPHASALARVASDHLPVAAGIQVP